MTYASVLAGLSVVSDLVLDEASGTTAAASPGTNGTYPVSGVTYSQTALLNDGGTAVAFDGGSGEVQVPTTGLLSTAGAVAFWCLNTDAMMMRGHDTTNAGWLLGSNGASVTVRANVNTSRNTPVASSAVNDGVRHFFVVTTDGATCKVYIDGAVVDSFAAAQAFSTIHSPLHFGRSGNNLTPTNYYAGIYDRITLFGQNLSASDVLALWQAGTGTPLTGGAAKTVTISATSAGRLGLTGAAAKTVTISRTAAGALGVTGVAAKQITVATSSAGQRGALGAAAKTISVSTSSDGLVLSGVAGDVAKTVTISATAAGALGLSGQATKVVTVGTSSAGVRGRGGDATKVVTVGTSSAGVRGRPGGAAKVLSISTSSDGVVTSGGGGGAAIRLADGTTLTAVGYADGSKTLTVLGWLDADGVTIHPFA